MSYFNDIIKHQKDVKNNKYYESYFDEKKRNLTFKRKIIFPRSFKVELIYQNLVEYLTKELIDFDQKKIILNKDYHLKNNSQLICQVVDYNLNEFITFLVQNGKTANYITYQLIVKRSKIVLKLKQITVYPYMIFGPKGNQIKWEDKQKFKIFAQNLAKKLNNKLQPLKENHENY